MSDLIRKVGKRADNHKTLVSPPVGEFGLRTELLIKKEIRRV